MDPLVDLEKHPMAIVLDLDGTLISEVGDPMDAPVLRPGAGDFLHWCFESFETVGVWTAASEGWYEQQFAELLEPAMGPHKFHFVWTGESCVKIRGASGSFISCDWQYPDMIKIKPIDKIADAPWARERGITKHNILVIDDTPATYQRNYGNAIPVGRFHGDEDDIDLDIARVAIMKKVLKHAMTGSVRS